MTYYFYTSPEGNYYHKGDTVISWAVLEAYLRSCGASYTVTECLNNFSALLMSQSTAPPDTSKAERITYTETNPCN